MISGWIMLATGMLISVGVFLNGLRFARMTRNPWANRKLFGQPIEGSEMPIGQVRLLGLVQVIVGPIFAALFAAMCFGAFGPVQNIQTISFQ